MYNKFKYLDKYAFFTHSFTFEVWPTFCGGGRSCDGESKKKKKQTRKESGKINE